jgi:hypothetical protein
MQSLTDEWRCVEWFRAGKAHSEHKISGLTSKTDSPQVDMWAPRMGPHEPFIPKGGRRDVGDVAFYAAVRHTD